MNQRRKPAPEQDPCAFLAGGGEMGERTRVFDWSKTPVGPAAEWPQSLKIVVRIMLDSRYAMWLGWGPDFTFFYNDAYAEMTLGPKHPWALGRPAREVWSEIWNDIGPRAESVVRNGQATWDEGLLLFLERRGFPEETYHTFSYSPIPNDKGGIGGMLCVVTEDTERTLGERRLHTLRELAARTTEQAKSVEDACQAAAMTLAKNPYDLPFVLIYLLDANAATARLAGAAGLTPGSLAAPRQIDLAAPGARPGWPLREVLESGRAKLVTELGRRFGRLPGGAWPEPPQQAFVLPLSKPGQTGYAGFLVAAASPRLLVNDTYKGFFDLLAGHVATAVTNAGAYEEERRRAEALAELDRAKTAFFTNISHEFRTPLTLILSPLEDALADTTEPGQRDRLELLQRNALRLQKLVNTLLDFSRIESGRVQASFEPTNLAVATGELASVFRSAIEKAGLSLIVTCPPLSEEVYVDRDMYEKVVLNLLSNAFKFTFEGEIEVQLREAAGAVELSVSDTGSGIAEEQLPHIFERFHRIEGAKARTHEGTGIGLALVHELVKLHGGTMRVQSLEGKGSTFTVVLPLGKSHLPADRIGSARCLVSTALAAEHYVEEARRWLPKRAVSVNTRSDFETSPKSLAAQHASVDASGRRQRIVWADDNADMRAYVSHLLGPLYDVEAVPDGEAALAAILRELPSLVLADVMMPRLDGFALLRALRTDERTRGLPVIMLSARAGEEARIEGMQAGADDYLIKPFSARELLARIGAHLEMAQVRRETEKALRESEERFRTMADSAPVMIWVADADTACTYLNRSWYEFTGQTPQTGLGLGWSKALHPDDREHVREIFAKAHTERNPFRLEYRVRHKDGDYRWAIDSAAPRFGPDGRFLGYIGSVIDITDRKKAEHALQEADRRKNEFLAMLAHELRNPLAPIRNALGILRLAEGNIETIGSATEIMDRQIAQMVRLVDDLLDVSRISRGKIELRRGFIDLASSVRHAVESVRPLCESKGLQLSVSLPREPVYLNADPIRLSQVVANLLSNACKFTNSGGQIWLTAEVKNTVCQDKSEEKGEHDPGGKTSSAPCDLNARVQAPEASPVATPHLVLRVRDTGIGIAADQLPLIFEMFTQVDTSLERTRSGLGIGLALAKTLVELHDGELEGRSAGLGHGSEFVIRLPLANTVWDEEEETPSGKDSLATQPSPLAACNKRRILVVDDNLDSAESLTVLLELAGNETRTAYDGVEALEAASSFRPDVILLDIGLPELNGYDVARKIREQSWGKDIVLVALTGWGQEGDRLRSQEAGINHHFTKPVDPGALKKLLAAPLLQSQGVVEK